MSPTRVWSSATLFLTAVDGLPKGINYAGYVGHSALRTYAMGERAFEKPATEDDVRAMERELRQALSAGAMGFTTSRSPSHETPDRRPVASRVATWDEVRRLVSVMGEMNAGVFEIAGERFGGDPAGLRDYHVRLRDLAVETGRPITWGLFTRREEPTLWRTYIALPRGNGPRRRPDVRPGPQPRARRGAVVQDQPAFRQAARLEGAARAVPRGAETPAARSRAALTPGGRRAIGAEARPASYDWIFVMDSPTGPYRSVADVARERSCDPVEAMIDLALERDLDRFFLQPIANEDQDHALELVKHPRTAVTFSDSGAHVSQIMDASLQTHLLAHWVRDGHQVFGNHLVEQGVLGVSRAIRGRATSHVSG